jgi:hypothetical protein
VAGAIRSPRRHIEWNRRRDEAGGIMPESLFLNPSALRDPEASYRA